MITQERYNELVKQAPHLINSDGRISIPERLYIARLSEDQFYKDTMQYYKTHPLDNYNDEIVLHLLGLDQPRRAMAIMLLRDSTYRAIPTECKFEIEVIGDSEISLEYHGPERAGFSLEELTHSPGIVVNNHKFSTFYNNTTFDYSSYDQYIRDTYDQEKNRPQCYTGMTKDYDFFINDHSTYDIEPVWKKEVPGKYGIFSKMFTAYTMMICL